MKEGNIKICSKCNEGKSVVTERFNWNFEEQDILNDILINTITNFKEHIRIINKNIFAKRYTPNWSEVFVISKIKKKTVPWTYVINDLNGEEIVGIFYKNELQKTNQKNFKIEKVIKKKENKLYVKWKVYDNSFNSWFGKSDLI